MGKLIELLTGNDEARYAHFNNTLDIKPSERKFVKHYPISSVCENQIHVDSTVAYMIDAQWLTFKHHYQVSFNEKYPDVSFDDILLSGDKIGAVLVCPPHRFMHIGTDIEIVKPFVFQYDLESGKIEVCVEMNYSFEIY